MTLPNSSFKISKIELSIMTASSLSAIITTFEVIGIRINCCLTLAIGNDIQSRNKFTLFLQPFIFNISQDQIQYLWGRMITMMNKISNGTLASPVHNSSLTLSPRISLLIAKGIRNVISLLLQLGAHSKPRDEVLHYLEGQNFNEYSIENKRKIVIEHDYQNFRNLLKQISII